MPTEYTDLLLPTVPQLHHGRPQSSHVIRNAVLALNGEHIPNGINWVAHCLVKLQEALLMKKTEGGEYEITERGKELLATGVTTISLRTLEQYPEYVQAQTTTGIHAAESRVSGTGS